MKIFLDTADHMEMLKADVDGFTTNPTLMRKAGVKDYEGWAKHILKDIKKPISFEVIADEIYRMRSQAKIISSWGDNVYVKIPVTTTKGEYTHNLIQSLERDGIKVNMTAVFTPDQIKCEPSIISVFVGRLVDTWQGWPIPIRASVIPVNKSEMLWASTRQVADIYAAENQEWDIITVSPEILAKRHLKGKDLKEFSLDTVKQFYQDAKEAGYVL